MDYAWIKDVVKIWEISKFDVYSKLYKKVKMTKLKN